MTWDPWMRQIHRWLSLIFTAVVAVNFVAFGMGEPPAWLYLLPLPLLALQLLTGLYLFAIPYVAKRRGRRAGLTG